MTLRDTLIECNRCGSTFPKKREGQRYCSKACSVAAAVSRHRRKSAGIPEVRADIPEEVLTDSPPLQPIERSAYSGPRPTPRAPDAPPAISFGFGKPGDQPLQGDDYPLLYHEDGYPRLPACLDRRKAVRP